MSIPFSCSEIQDSTTLTHAASEYNQLLLSCSDHSSCRRFWAYWSL